MLRLLDFTPENYFSLKTENEAAILFISLSITYNLMTLREVRNFNLRSFSVDIFLSFCRRPLVDIQDLTCHIFGDIGVQFSAFVRKENRARWAVPSCVI